MDNKLNIGVVFGGQSGEHEVSRVSAYNVLGVIDREKYNIVTIGISKKENGFYILGTRKRLKMVPGNRIRPILPRTFQFSPIRKSPRLMFFSRFFMDRWEKMEPFKVFLKCSTNPTWVAVF